MATITIQITDGGEPVGSGWQLVYGDSGTGKRTTNGSGQIVFSSVPATYQAALAFVIIDPADTVRTGGAGMYIAAGGTYTLGS